MFVFKTKWFISAKKYFTQNDDVVFIIYFGLFPRVREARRTPGTRNILYFFFLFFFLCCRTGVKYLLFTIQFWFNISFWFFFFPIHRNPIAKRVIIIRLVLGKYMLSLLYVFVFLFLFFIVVGLKGYWNREKNYVCPYTRLVYDSNIIIIGILIVFFKCNARNGYSLKGSFQTDF